jgi:peroxiredoxin
MQFLSRFGARLFCVCLIASLAATSAVGQRSGPPAPAAPDVKTLGPQVGDKVPDFRLPDQHGQVRTLSSLMGPKGLILVFNRSADWCPYCKTQLLELQGRVGEIRKAGLGLVSISYDPVPVLADFASRRAITFPMLSDAGSAIIKKYGILNTTVPKTNPLFGHPFPGTFMLNREGVVTSRFFEDTIQERDTISSVLVRLGGKVEAPARKTSAPHLEITSYLTDQVAAPGTHFSIVLDFKPAPRVHVYAPGVSGYKPIGLTVQPQAGLVVRDPQYPKAEDYFFKPLNEHVPVYQRPFRVVQDVMLDPSREAAAALRDLTTMTIAATLNYQACDDKLCFSPQSVPLSWTVNVRPLDVERVKRQ